MQADEQLVSYIVSTYYDITPILGSIKPLCGYSDKNFLLTDKQDSRRYVLKIVNKEESQREITEIVDEILDNAYGFCRGTLPTLTSWPEQMSFMVPKLIKTTGNKLSTYTSVRHFRGGRLRGVVDDDEADENVAISDLEPSIEMIKCNIKLMEYFDGITMFDYLNGTPVAKTWIRSFQDYVEGEKLDQNKQLYGKIGRASLELFMFLRTQRPLIEQLRAARKSNAFPWQLTTCEPHLRKLLDHLYPMKIGKEVPGSALYRRNLVERVLNQFLLSVRPQLDLLPEFILHGDLCNRNIMLNWDSSSPQTRGKLCFIDFQDLQVGPQVVDLAVLMLYQVIEQETRLPLDKALKWIPRWLLQGYQSVSSCLRLSVAELMLVPELMKLRLCQSLLNGQMAYEADPSNEYVMHTNQRGWQLLELMSLSEDPTKLVAFWQTTDDS